MTSNLALTVKMQCYVNDSFLHRNKIVAWRWVRMQITFLVGAVKSIIIFAACSAPMGSFL